MTCCRKVVPVLGSPMCRNTFGRDGTGVRDIGNSLANRR